MFIGITRSLGVRLSNWKNILPEITAVPFALAIGIKDLGFTDALLFLAIAILLRIVWNSAIIIHGLGHVVAIAIVDGEKSVSITNILEQRSIATTLKSLLPFNPIFIPWLDRQSDLWVAAGNITKWRIRVKALGGIGFNLFAASVMLLIYARSYNDILARNSALLSQIFISANLLIAASSWTDIAAFITGVAENLYCGNFGFLGQRNSSDDPRLLLPERVVNMFYLMGRETEIRGEQAGGGLVVARDRNDQIVFVGKKVVNKKRDNLTTSLEAAFATQRRKSASVGIVPLESSVMGVWHYRFGTSGPPAVLETHWHEWMSARYADVWQFSEGKWQCQSRNVNHRITHNGDFDAWLLFDKSIENVELGWWLERVLNTPNHTKGDSPKIAGMMDLLITQGMWYASVRLAYQLAIANSINSAFGGREPAADAPNTAPSQSDLASWAEIFEKVFVSYRHLLGAPDSPSCNEYLCRLENDVLQATALHNSLGEWSWQKRLAFVRTAIHAFFHNDLYFATKTFMSRAKGSFGLVTVSTLDKEQLVLSAQGQPISIGFNYQEGYMVYASEPAAVDAVLLNLPQSYRLDLDQTGEIALVSAKNIRVYSMTGECELTPELKTRWISMEDHPYLPHVKYPQNDTKDPIANDTQEIPVTLGEIKLSWQNPTALSRQSADYLVELLRLKAQSFEQKQQKMLRAGLTSHLRQLPTVDLLIMGVENSLWLGERFAQDLKIVFPWLNVQCISANQVLQQLSQDFSSLHLGQDSIVLAITQSGQTFPTVQAINTFDQLRRQGVIDELFILTGELGSFLGSPVIQPKNATNCDRHNIFVNGSGRRTSEAATVAVAAAHVTLTELLFYVAKQMRQAFPDSSPLGMTLAKESLEILEKMKEDFLDINVVQIIGITPTGVAIASTTKQTLIAGGRNWANHITEAPLAWGIHALYVAISVGWAIFFGYTIPLAKTIFNLILWLAQIPQDVFLVKLIDPVVTLVDIAIYIFGSWLWTLALRYFQGRQLLARIGKRTLVIGDVTWVNQLLKSYVSKMFSLSYGITSLEVHGANPEDDLLHDFGHRVVRGTLLFLGVPDGRRSQKLKQKESATIMAGKQADGVRNIDVGPEVVVMGSNPEIARKGFSKAIILESNDDYFYFRKDAFYFKDKNIEDQKALIEELRESRFGAFERMLASYIFFWALAKKVASFPLLKYQYWKSQSRTKIMTTAAPVAGVSLANPGKKRYQPKQDTTPESVKSNVDIPS